MPTSCEDCGLIFDLNDGATSPRKDTIIICKACAYSQQAEIDNEDEIEELNNQISDAEYTLKEARKRLAELENKPASYQVMEYYKTAKDIERFVVFPFCPSNEPLNVKGHGQGRIEVRHNNCVRFNLTLDTLNESEWEQLKAAVEKAFEIGRTAAA